MKVFREYWNWPLLSMADHSLRLWNIKSDVLIACIWRSGWTQRWSPQYSKWLALVLSQSLMLTIVCFLVMLCGTCRRVCLVLYFCLVLFISALMFPFLWEKWEPEDWTFWNSETLPVLSDLFIPFLMPPSLPLKFYIQHFECLYLYLYLHIVDF